MPKFRDHSLIPTEAVRLTALGILAAGERPYGDLAIEVRHFVSRMLGPTLDVLGTSIELLRHEGLIEPIDLRAGPSHSLRADTRVRLTDSGKAALQELLTCRVRAPMTDLTRMIVALKLRFLHLLTPQDQRAQFESLIELATAEIARLTDLRRDGSGPAGALSDWLDHELAQSEERRRWYQQRLDTLQETKP